METYPIEVASPITLEKLQAGLFIFMLRVDRIPPHLGIIVNGKLFDISLVGPNIALPIIDVYKTILKRKTASLFFELQHSFSNNISEETITEKVNKYKKVSKNCSCIKPIKDFISVVYGLNVDKANFIFELLPILHDNDLIKNISQLNLNNQLKGNVYNLKKYTSKEVENCINALTRKEKLPC